MAAQPGRLADDGGFNPCSSDNTCVLCGQLDEPCCTIAERDVCGAENLMCGRGTCDPCGEDQQPCCDGDACAGDAPCVEGMCVGTEFCSSHLCCRQCRLLTQDSVHQGYGECPLHMHGIRDLF